MLPRISPLLILVIFCVDGANAQPREGKPEEGPVYTDPQQTDADFPFQGEYVGWRRGSRWGRETRPTGLQVIARGDGEFAATGYAGGLPGEGWFGGDRQLYEGQRNGDVVEFTSEGTRLVVDGQTARFLTEDDKTVGQLHKVHRSSPTAGAIPPAGAVNLFDGRDTSQLVDAAVTPEGWLQAGTQTVKPFGDFRLHGEFRLPYKPLGRGQNRGNSGFYIQSRYEVQVLDTFGLEGIENECGALYKTKRPDINMCYPPLSWQTYDIDFATPRFDEQGQKLSDMRISVWHNGVPIHLNADIPHKTGAGKPEGPNPLPMIIQDHSNPVMFRNIWLIEPPYSPAQQKAEMASASDPSAGRQP